MIESQPRETGGAGAMLPALLLSRLLSRTRRRCLVGVTYHRIAPDDLPRAPGSGLTFSALTANFRRQLRILANSTQVVPASQLVAWLHGDAVLPARASLITFDDGYRDNLTLAHPILQEVRVPAIVYLSTGYMGTQAPLYWHHAAYSFRQAEPGRYTLPVTGAETITAATLNAVAHRWIAATKALPPEQRLREAEALAEALNTAVVPPDAFRDFYLSWDEVRRMRVAGVEFGAHSVTHPILSAVPDAVAQREIIDSKQRIEAELGESVTSFAYPNGLPADYTDRHVAMVREAGFDMAFTLSPGPVSQAAVRLDPYRIPRIYVGLKDTPMRFALKLWGAARVRGH